MPVDDDIMKIMLKNAYDKLTTNGEERTKLKQFIQACTEITKIQSSIDPKVMEDVVDKNLGVKMSSARRQAIYDKLLIDKTGLGL